MSVTLRHRGLPEGIVSADLIEVLRFLSLNRITLNHRQFGYLKIGLKWCQPNDFLPGQICAFWPRVEETAVLLGCTVRQVYTIECQLEENRFISLTFGANGRRHGKREKGKILLAAGANFAPCIERYSEFAQLRDDHTCSRQLIVETRGDVQNLWRKIRSTSDEALIAAARLILPDGRCSTINDLGKLARIRCELSALIEAYLDGTGAEKTSDASEDCSGASARCSGPAIQTQDLSYDFAIRLGHDDMPDVGWPPHIGRKGTDRKKTDRLRIGLE